MPTLPTSNERTDNALTIARTKAAAYADTGNMGMAYKALLRGVQYAQRVNNSSNTQTTLAGLWAMPVVKAATLGGITATAAAVTRSKTKTKSTTSKTQSTPSGPSQSTTDTSTSRVGRFRRRPRATDQATAPDPTVTTQPQG